MPASTNVFSDFTVRLDHEEFEQYCTATNGTSVGRVLSMLIGVPKNDEPGYWRYSGQLPVRIAGSSDSAIYRALICRSEGNTAYSATFRKLDAKVAGSETIPPLEVKPAPLAGIPTTPEPTGYFHCDDITKLLPWTNGGYLFGVQHTADALCDQLARLNKRSRTAALPQIEPPLNGLIVVSGRTGVAKNKVAERIIDEYLHRCWSQIDCNAKVPMRRPHLIALQDPTENLFISPKATTGFDYTPRNFGLDYWFLDEALEDALRQTPALLYIGEVRNPLEWKPILQFAGSGHLCVTTAHAGSLVEAMRTLIEELPARTSDERSSLAHKILALIHLKGKSEEAGGMKFSYTLPSMWCRCERSIASFVSDGLASILPHRGDAFTDAWRGCLGRRFFADTLLPNRKNDFDEDAKGELYKAIHSTICLQATSWDLKGE